MSNKQVIKSSILAIVLVFAHAGILHAEDMVLSVKFTNPSDIDTMEKEARFYLPVELKQNNVVNTGGLQLTYDEARSRYYVHEFIKLKPKETKEFKVTVQNVWLIDTADIDFLKDQIQERVDALDGTEQFDRAQELGEKLMDELNQIMSFQIKAGDANIKEKIEIYRVNMERLRNVRNTVLLIEDFKSLIEEESQLEEAPRLIEFKIKITNTSETEPKTEHVKQYLAEGIKGEHVIDAKGFDIKFDPEKRLYYLEDDVDLKPGETKNLVLTFEDRWFVQDGKLNGFDMEAEDIAVELSDTQFEDRVKYLVGEVKKNIATIRDLQGRKVGIRDKMAFFKDNNKRLDVIKENILELRRMMEIIRERERQKRLEEILRRVFREAAWKIIYGTITLLAVITVMTFILWWGQTKVKQLEDYEEIE